MAWTNSAVASATFTITTPKKYVNPGVINDLTGEPDVGSKLMKPGDVQADIVLGTNMVNPLTVDKYPSIIGRGVRIKHPDVGDPFKVKIKET